MKKLLSVGLCLLLLGQAVAAVAQDAVVHTEKGRLNLRAKPDSEACVVAYAPNGSAVTLAGEAEGGWRKVTYRGKTGYAMTQFLVPEEGLPDASPDAEEPDAAAPADSAMPGQSAAPADFDASGDPINGAVARGVADATLRRAYPAFAEADISYVSSLYCTETDEYAAPTYQFDYFDEAGNYVYAAVIHAYTREVLYLFGGLPGEGKG